MIHIFYRHYNINGTDNRGRPHWFDYEKCFQNLLSTIEGQPVDLHVIFDGQIENNFIWKYKDLYTLHQIEAGTDQVSFTKTWEIVNQLEIKDDDLIYFLENDYLHIKDWTKEVINLFNSLNPEIHYVSLYDHGDKYLLPMYDNLTSKIFTSPTRHWRTTPSTCGSFIVTKKLFKDDFDIHTTISGDHNKFLELNSSRSRAVLTPIPSLSTHCMEGLLSPTINWEKINN